MKQCRKHLRHRDRWRVEDMLAEREQHSETSDIEVWQRLYMPSDLVRIGDVLSPAHVAPPAEYCCGCTWSADGTQRDTVAYCLSAADLLRGATCAERMSPREACEAVLGRMRAAGWPILLVVDDGEGLLELWVDAWCTRVDAGDYPGVPRGRCPSGTNSRTGHVQRGLWAYEGLWAPWTADDWRTTEADLSGDWLEGCIERIVLDNSLAVQPRGQDPGIGSCVATGRSHERK